MTSTPGASTRKPNRRGVAAREQLLATALRLLGDGRPEAVSINLVAKEAGLSWGSVQNLFGDSDGFWSAVVEQMKDAGADLWAEPTSDTVAGRLKEVADLYRGLLESPHGVAIETIKAGLPRPRAVLAETHPKTAASLTELDQLGEVAFLRFFEGLDAPNWDEQKARDVAAVLPSAMRGLRLDKAFGTSVDIDKAQATLVAALTTYIQG
ncbi:TetR/AcrR family transcriptional regulator [Nocardioides sp. J54]|uniref:TetR/AcrR family transcriptional regulator n=1 Tax=Nocardioides sp. J54 TaxID=935866 RepID=UPI00048A4DC9|nr:TetR/AcrR family transcriptional regulator [Nocardioides sp. J54]